MASRLLISSSVLSAIFLASLALTPAEVAAAPIYCEERENRYSVLLPRRGQSGVPTNASVWLTENPNAPGGGLQLLDEMTGESVLFDEEVIVARGRTLLRLVPTEDLAPLRTYRVRHVRGDMYERSTMFTTGPGPDMLAPDAPTIETVESWTDPCLGHGLRIDTSITDGPVLLFAYGSGSDDLLSFASSFSTLLVPGTDGEVVQFEAVAIDVVGNQSVRTPMREAAVGPADVVGGCVCVSGRSSTPWGAAALLVSIWLIGLTRARFRPIRTCGEHRARRPHRA